MILLQFIFEGWKKNLRAELVEEEGILVKGLGLSQLEFSSEEVD